MHIPYESEILLVPRRLTYCAPPFLNSFQNPHLYACWPHRGPFGKPADELIKEFFGTDLKMKRVSAILDANIEQTESKQRDVGVSVVDVVHNGDCSLTRRRALLRINEVRDLKVDCQVGLEVLRAAGLLNVSL